MASVSASIDPLYTHSAEGTVFRKYLQSTLCLTNSSLQNSNNAIHSIKKGFIYQRKSISSFKNQLSKREFLINTNESLSKDPVSKAFPRRSFIKSSLKLSSPTEQKLFITKKKKAKEILPFVNTYKPATPNVKKILMKHWHIIQQQPRLAHIFNQPPIVSYRKEKSKSLQDISVHAKLPSITPQSQKVVNKEVLTKGLFSKQKEMLN